MKYLTSVNPCAVIIGRLEEMGVLGQVLITEEPDGLIGVEAANERVEFELRLNGVWDEVIAEVEFVNTCYLTYSERDPDEL